MAAPSIRAPGAFTFQRGRLRFVVPFLTPTVHEPRPADVLRVLLEDAAAVERGFAHWATAAGYPRDSRGARYRYWVLSQQTKRLRHFLGDAFDTFIHAHRNA